MDLNLTTDMTRGGLQMEMSKLYIALYHGDGPAIKNASMHAWGPVSDKYGNANYAQLIGTTLAAAEAQRVNWNTDSATLQLAVLPGIWKTFLGNANLGWPQSRN